MDGIAPIYRFIVAHLTPGIVFLLPLTWISIDVRELTASALSSSGTISQVFILIGGCLVSGLLIDGVCFVTTVPLVDFLCMRCFEKQQSHPKPTDVSDFEFIDRVYSMHYSWHQLYVNVATVMTFSAILVLLDHAPLGRLNAVWLIVVAALLFVASARSSANYHRLLAQKWP